MSKIKVAGFFLGHGVVLVSLLNSSSVGRDMKGHAD